MAIASDFIAAVVAQLQQTGSVASAFGDTTTTPKFQGTVAFRPAALPFARLIEVGEESLFQSIGSDGATVHLDRGELQVDVFATSEASARSLGRLVAAALNDAPIVFADGTLLELRQSRSFFVPEPDPGPGAAVVYHRVVLFTYLIQRSL